MAEKKLEKPLYGLIGLAGLWFLIGLFAPTMAIGTDMLGWVAKLLVGLGAFNWLLVALTDGKTDIVKILSVV